MLLHMNYKDIDPSILPYIHEVITTFPGKVYERSPKESRDLFSEHAKTLPLIRNNKLIVSDHELITPEGKITVRIYRPTIERRRPAALVYMHGGGWIMGDLNSHDKVCVDLCLRCRLTVIALDYGLSPENRFPVALNQCFSSYLELLNNKMWLGSASKNIMIAGDSAGGNLAAALSMKLRLEAKPLPKAQILFYPCLSLNFESPSYIKFANAPILDKKSMKWFWSVYLDKKFETNDPLAVPLLEKNLSGLPKTIICTAEIDPLASEGIRFKNNLVKCSTIVEHINAKAMVHGFIRFRDKSPVADKYFWLVCKKINEFLGMND